MFDRILVAPFLKTIPEEKRDKEVLRRLTNDPGELMVAIAWLVQGYFDRKDYGLQIPDSVTQGKEEYEVQVNPLYEFVNNEVIFDDGRKNGEIHHETRTLTGDLLQRVWDTEGKVVNNSRQFNKQFKELLPYFEKKTGIKAELKHQRDGAAWLNVRLSDEGDEVLSEKEGQSTSVTCDDVTDNTTFGESNLSNLVDYYRHLHQNPDLCHIITPSFVSILIEDLDAPELDLEASEGTIENAPESEDSVTEPESTLTKGKCQPSHTELAEVIHNILTEFKHAAKVAKLKVEYSPLQEAVCARIRRDRPEWSEYDLETAYDHFYEKDAEINTVVVSVCDPSSKVRNKRSSAERQ